MARFAFVVPPFRGHMDPMASLGRELARRGHGVVFLGQADAAGLAGGHGFDFVPLGARTHPPGHLAGVTARMAGTSGLLGLRAVLRDVVASTAMLVAELPDRLRELRVDAVLGDQAEAAAGLVARRLDLPLVSVANALPLNREPAVPPPFLPWPFDPSERGRSRNLGGYRVSDLLMRRHGDLVADTASRWRLGPLRTVEDCASGLAQVSQIVRGLDLPRERLPASFHYVGPLRGATAHAAVALPVDGRPLAFASLGSLQGGRAGLFRIIAEALSRQGFRPVIAHGGRLTDADARRLPGDPLVFPFVPQAAVLARTGLAVLHGGLNTVLDAAAAGVPAIVLPIAFEQGAIAMRVARAGMGVAVNRRFLTAGRLGRAVGTVLSDPGFARSAGRMAAEIAGAGGVGRAADIVEQVVRTGRAVPRLDADLAPSRSAAA